jgi:hypothetical protein
VTGGEDDVLFDAGVGNLQNSGTITATLDDGDGMSQWGTLTNAVGALISGVAGVDGGGIFTSGGAATITNNGQVNGARYAILVAAGGSVTNSSTGTIKGKGSGVSLSRGGTLSNSGAISSTAASSAAADLEFGGTINNFQGATLTGASFGAFQRGSGIRRQFGDDFERWLFRRLDQRPGQHPEQCDRLDHRKHGRGSTSRTNPRPLLTTA